MNGMQTDTLHNHLVNGGRVEHDRRHYRLILPPTGAEAYADAQIDNYEHELPRNFPDQPPRQLAIQARFSHRQMKGTAGFGFWNHPFSRDGGVIAPPCNVWFFYSSPESNMQVARGQPGHGFKAAVLNSYPSTIPSVVRMPGILPAVNLLLKLPGLSRLVLSAARAVINARETMIDADMTQWHAYGLNWQARQAIFTLDGREILRAPSPPQIALGFVAWVDNYRATAAAGDKPRGARRYEFACVQVAEEQWMELEFV